MIVGPGACIAFSRQGYKMSDINFSDLLGAAMNIGLWKFAIANPSLSVGELWK
jgi:2-hydroxyglutarate dehydrogenase